jgi:hypothetical protein
MRILLSLIGVTAAAIACSDSAAPAGALSSFGDGTTNGHSAPLSDGYCSGVISGGAYENIKVREGTACTLIDVRVKGNVVALQDARLFVQGSRVEGNIQGENAAVVHVLGGVIGGSVQIHEGSSPGENGVLITGGTVLTQGNIQVTKMRTAQIVVEGALLMKGNLQVEENTVSDLLDVTGNDVRQNLEVRKNRGDGGKFVTVNTVRQKLECRENSGPFTGAPNNASEIEGNCG